MAKDQFSFDIVSEVDMQEVRNAVDQTGRELSQRFDFKNTGTTVELKDEAIELHSSTEDRLKAAWQVLQERAIKRNIPLKSLQAGTVEEAAKGTAARRHGRHRHQRREDQGDLQVRAPGSAEDPDADPGSAGPRAGQEQGRPPEAIAAVKGHDFGLALQFTNYRP